MRRQSELETLYVDYDVAATDFTGNPQDLSGDSVWLAFPAPGVDPVPGDLKAATWLAPGRAGVLVGPDNGGLNLAKGLYDVHMKIADSPEVFFEKIDKLQIY